MAVYWSLSQVIDQLDSGEWWLTSTITYAFPTTYTATFYNQGEQYGFSAVPVSLQPVFVLAIETWNDLIPLSFVQATPGNTDIEFAFTDTGIDYAHAYYPVFGTAWFESGQDAEDAEPGSYGFTTIMHEIGHALGLDHMGDYNGAGSWDPSSYQDSRVLSIMSYFGPSGGIPSSEVMQANWRYNGIDYSPDTPMVNDIAAIQAIYGVSGNTRLGDTTYGFHSNVDGYTSYLYDFTLNYVPILTLFDSGGNDTLDLSGWSTASFIDLGPGAYSSANGMTNNIAIAYSATIENAVGGSGADTLTGNSAANSLAAGSGSDTLNGGGGDDTLTGGAGNDVMYGGDGTDTAKFSGVMASYTITFNNATGSYSVVSSADGSDTLYGIEKFQFTDQTKVIGAAADTKAPTLVSVTPATNTSSAATNSNLTLTFDEAVKAGTGSILIYRTGGVLERTISISDASLVTFNGSTITVDPGADLSASQGYYVNVTSGAVLDQSNNAFTGITGTASFNFTTAQAVTDDYTYNGSTTGVVTVNGPAVTATINFGDDADMFKVTLVAGNTYTFELKGATLSDPYLMLFSPTQEIVDSDDDGGEGFNSKIVYTARTSGTYYLGASAYGVETGTYTISATSFGDDYLGNSTTQAVLNVGGQLAGAIDFATDEDWFKVSLQAGVTYYFELKGVQSGAGTLGSGTSHDPYLTLYNPSGFFIDSAYTGGASGDPAISYTATSSGTYYLAAEELFGTGTGTYVIAAKSLGTTFDDYANNSSTTATLTIGGQLLGSIEVANDADWFKVVLQAGTTYTFDLKAIGSGGGSLGGGAGLHAPYLSLYAPNGFFIDSTFEGGPGDDPEITYTATTSGTYYLVAEELFATGTGTYTLKATQQVVDDYAASSSTTGIVTVNGSTASGTINYADDADWFKVSLQAGTEYVFELSGHDSGGGTLGTAILTQPYLSLFGPTGLYITATGNGGTGGDPKLTFTPSTTGTYFLDVEELFGTGTGTYKVKATTSAALDITPPTIASFAPTTGQLNAKTTQDIVVTFSEAIQRGTGSIVLHGSNGINTSLDAATNPNITVSGNTLTLHVSSLAYSTTYTIELAGGTVKDLAGNAFLGFNAYTFSTRAAGVTKTGTGGADTLTGTIGDDTFNGGEGRDTVVYGHARTDYGVHHTSTGFTVSGPDGDDTLNGIERITFTDQKVALDLAGNAGQAYRLYQAAFDRTPDIGGVGFQMNQLDIGRTLASVAGDFLASPEFQSKYGNVSDSGYVSLLYQNVLHRTAAQDEIDFHVSNELHAGYSRAQVLTFFSESPENQANVVGAIQDGIVYTYP